MKKVVILLFSFLLFGFKNPNNDAPIIIHFEQILNEYRHSNGLNPIKIDHSMKEFTELRSKDLLTDFSHNGFDENILSYTSNFTFAGENVAKVAIHTNYGESRLSSSIKEIEEILRNFKKNGDGNINELRCGKTLFINMETFKISQ